MSPFAGFCDPEGPQPDPAKTRCSKPAPLPTPPRRPH